MSTDSYDLDLDDDTGDERAAIVVQAASDRQLAGEKTPGETVSLAGRHFRVADKVGLMPLLKFSHAAGKSTNDSSSFVALYQILQDIIRGPDATCGTCKGCLEAENEPTALDCLKADPGDWEEFVDWAIECKADSEELLDVVSEAFVIITARPTTQPSDSSRTSRRTSRKSTGGSSARPGGGSNGSRRGRRAT